MVQYENNQTRYVSNSMIYFLIRLDAFGFQRKKMLERAFPVVTVWLLCFGCHATLDFVYHQHESLQNYLINISETYSNITHLYSIGKSIQGRFSI